MTAEQLANALEFRAVYKSKRKTQNQMVWEYMVRYGSITQQEAIDAFDCYRLAARIADLKAIGKNIETVKTKDYWAAYRIVKEEESDERHG